jgi:hypothetical protein
LCLIAESEKFIEFFYVTYIEKYRTQTISALMLIY